MLEGRLICLALQAVRLGASVVLDFGLRGRVERSAPCGTYAVRAAIIWSESAGRIWVELSNTFRNDEEVVIAFAVQRGAAAACTIPRSRTRRTALMRSWVPSLR